MLILFLVLLFALLLITYLGFLNNVLKGIKKVKLLSFDDQEFNELSINNYFVSVIIPFRNESENIIENLRSLENQDYPKNKFEVIYVDDNSEDDSLKKIKNAINSGNVKVICVPNGYSPNAHKKRAIRYGIENSKGEIIVTTDADCYHSKNWLRTLVASFNDKTGFISAPVIFDNFENEKVKIFYEIQKTEFMGLVLVGAGLIGIDHPTICNAANIAYRRKVFDEVNGFMDNLNLSSGDDELLMQKIHKATNYEIKFVFNENAIVKTKPNKNIKQFFHQRKRWASKGLFYENKLLILRLIFIYLFFVGLVVQIILGIFLNSIFFISFVISILLKMSFEYWILKEGIPLLMTSIDKKIFLLAELFHIPYIIISGFSGSLGNFQWKNRKLKR